jgi:hypothetical protein
MLGSEERFLAISKPRDRKTLSVLFGEHPIGAEVVVSNDDGINTFTVT